MKPELTDSRRLTGANLYWDFPAAIIEARLANGLTDDSALLVRCWDAAARTLLEAVGHPQAQRTSRAYSGGVNLLISSPIDQLYSMCELNEAAFAYAVAEQSREPLPELALEGTRLAELFRAERDPRLLVLQDAARLRKLPFLWDDDEVSIGYGPSCQVWPRKQLPESSAVPWNSIKSIPVALVTGTNGKSTTVRMSAAIIEAAGIRAGLTSTDWIKVGGQILDEGDYSGTGGARSLLRHPETEMAVLETARGGLLRRGLGVASASAALITNVAADHLGEYGINTVTDLIEAKFIVRRALRGDAPLILNADDAGIVAFAASLETPIIWFSLDPANPVVVRHLAANGRAAILDGDSLFLGQGEKQRAIIKVTEIPASFGGTARYNLANALGAMALCSSLGILDKFIRQGLQSFHGDETDNPGRGNWFEKNGVRILVDFAHNPHGTMAIADMVAHLPAKRRLLLIGQAGDRKDEDIRAMTLAACGFQPDTVLACALPGYERGRPQSEVLAVIRKAARDQGVPDQNIHEFNSPAEAAVHALNKAQAGDVLVLLVLTQRQAVMKLIHEYLKS